jgi:hypothetical protein
VEIGLEWSYIDELGGGGGGGDERRGEKWNIGRYLSYVVESVLLRLATVSFEQSYHIDKQCLEDQGKLISVRK